MKLIKRVLLFFISMIIILLIGITIYGYQFYKETISKEPLEDKVKEITNNYTYVKKEDMPQNYLNAIVAIEDRRYYKHKAVDYIGILRAIFSNMRNKEFQEGGSTITQQVAKNIYFTEEKNVVKRKVAEAFVANDLEKNYSKDEILEMYANIIYFGNNYYGIKEACNGYLNKEVKDMNLSEATMMAGIPNAPSVYAPTVNKELCKERQKQVVNAMLKNGYISQEEANSIDSSFIDEI